jgi:hypothetical protein
MLEKSLWVAAEKEKEPTAKELIYPQEERERVARELAVPDDIALFLSLSLQLLSRKPFKKLFDHDESNDS